MLSWKDKRIAKYGSEGGRILLPERKAEKNGDQTADLGACNTGAGCPKQMMPARPKKAQRTMEAMRKMKKLDIAELKRAYAG